MACAYDRAGILWSEPKSSPQNAGAVAQDLHVTLAAAGVSGPLVLVGHSLGGSYIMSITRRYPDDVEGLVFVDCSHPEQMERFPQKIADTMRVPLANKILVALSWTGIFRVLPLPDAPEVPDHIKTILAAYRGESVGSVLAEAEAIPTSLAQSGQLRDLGSRPTVVLTAQKPLPDQQLASLGLTPEEGDQYLALAKELHMDQASWSSRSRQMDFPDSGHLVQFDRPDIVTDAVNEVVEDVKTGR